MKKMNEKIEIENMSDYDNHEMVSFFYDDKTGLKGFISIHNTNLGSATGGTRYAEYPNERAALSDALRLSKAMTYKCALAGLLYGGGKAVIMKDAKHPKTKEFLYTYAEKVNLLNGNFSTGEDVGISEKDAGILAQKSKFIIGSPEKAGDPSPWASLGVFYAIRAALKNVFGNEEIKGKTFAVKGLGKVGLELCRLLYEQGAEIVAADISEQAIKTAKKKFPKIKIVSSQNIHKEKVDVYSPCAMGNEFNAKKIGELKCRIVCGGANNQLVSVKDGEGLYKRNILYIPDYLANGGGVINVVAELDKGGYNRGRVLEKVKNIQNTAAKIIEMSQKLKKPTNYVADELAKSIIYNKKPILNET